MILTKEDLQKRYAQIDAVDKERGFDGDNKPLFLCREFVDLDISVRALNVLKHGFEIKLEYIDELRAFNLEDIKAPNCGKKTREEIQELAESVGVTWFTDLHNSEEFEQVRVKQSRFEETTRHKESLIENRHRLDKKRLEFLSEIADQFKEAKALKIQDPIDAEFPQQAVDEKLVIQKIKEMAGDNIKILAIPVAELATYEEFSQNRELYKKLSEGFDIGSELIFAPIQKLRDTGIEGNQLTLIDNDFKKVNLMLDMHSHATGMVRKDLEKQVRIQQKQLHIQEKFGF